MRAKQLRSDAETGRPTNQFHSEPDEIAELYRAGKISSLLQRLILEIVGMYSYASRQPSMWAKGLTDRKLAKLTGKTRQACATALQDAVARHLLECQQGERGGKCGVKSCEYRRSPRGTPILDYIAAKPHEIEAPPRELARAFQLTLFPGRKSRFVIRIGDRDQAIECCNTLRQPAMLSGEVAADGTLIFSAADPKRSAKAQTTSHSGNWHNPLGQLPQDVVVGQRGPAEPPKPRQKPFRFASPEVEPQVINEYRTELVPLARDRWGHQLSDDDLLSLIKRADAAPIRDLADAVHRRLKRDSMHKLGKEILWLVAGDVARSRKEIAEAEAADPWVSDHHGGWVRRSEVTPEQDKTEQQQKEEIREWLLSLNDDDYRLVIADKPEWALPERAA